VNSILFLILISFRSILVLKDGQIVEQGSHKELVAMDGVFASMWADQISSTEDPAISVRSVKPEEGYSVGPEEVAANEDAEDTPPEVPPKVEVDLTEPAVPEAEVQVEVESPPEPEAELEPEPAPLTFPSSEEPESPVVAFPSNDTMSSPVSESPVVAFPVSDDTQSTTHSTTRSVPPTPAGVTFSAPNSPPRTGTPDPDAEPKRKRISSQNFQRLAKRISISTRRQGSVGSIIPGLKKDKDSSPRISVDDAAGGSGSVNDSPAPSEDGKKKKISRKDRKKTTST